MRLRLFTAVASLALASVTSATSSTGAADPPNLKPLVARANVLLQADQFHEAAKAYSDAIELSPADYLLYYKRATAYFSSGRHSAALNDVEKVVSMTEGKFHPAFLMEARIHTKEGEWVKARQVLKKYTQKAGKDKDSEELVADISGGEGSAKMALAFARKGDYEKCIEEATNAIVIASHNIPLRETRADCALRNKDYESAIGDLTRLTHLNTSTKLLLRLAHLNYYITGSVTQAMTALKHCLQKDPDDKLCRTSHRLFKAQNKDWEKLEKLDASTNPKGAIRLVIGYQDTVGLIKKFDEELVKATQSLELPSGMDAAVISEPRKKLYKIACKAYTKDNQPSRATPWCTTVLSMDPTDGDALMNKGDLAMSKEEWEEAVRAYQEAFEASGRSSRDIQEKLQKAQRLLKQSRKKDYYKVLGVSRDADERTIKKAYRAKAREAHPDKGGSEEKMAAVNEANEVLSNPELRARFDNGDDPNDPESERGGHPFQQGFQGFQSFPGGAQFHFQGGFPGGFPGGAFRTGGF